MSGVRRGSGELLIFPRRLGSHPAHAHRAADEQVEARLNVFRQYPGSHAVWMGDAVYTCGPMLESMKGAVQGPCGCILRTKARDLAEGCPFGWW